ncbi:hypothetical protein [Actinophytocola sp. KF-1]
MDIEWAARMSDLSENFKAILREHDDDGIGESARLYDRIDRVFNLFSCGEGFGDNSGVTRMSEHLEAAISVMTNDHERNFGGIRDDLDEWQGDAAKGFLTFVNDLADSANILRDRLATVKMILQAHGILVEAMREDVLDLVQKTLDGLAAAESDGWEVGVTVAGAVAAFATGVAGVGGMSLGMVLGLVAGEMAAGAAGVAVAAHAAEDELGVLVNFVDSAEAMLHTIDIERLRIEKAFRSLVRTITDGNLGQVRPDRPDVITAPSFDPRSFGMADHVQAGHPLPTDTSDLVPEPRKRADGPFDRAGDGHDRYQEQGPA